MLVVNESYNALLAQLVYLFSVALSIEFVFCAYLSGQENRVRRYHEVRNDYLEGQK